MSVSSFFFLLQVAATKAHEAAMALKKAVQQSKAAMSHLFAKTPTQESLVNRIKNWDEKIQKLEVGVAV